MRKQTPTVPLLKNALKLSSDGRSDGVATTKMVGTG
jgi:hypothetical protein